MRYTDDGTAAQLTLKVRILNTRYDNIGFRYRHNIENSEESKRKIIPNESRTKVLAEVTLLDTLSKKVLLGPAHIVGSIDYDHQNYDLNNDINTFSLGQLSDIDTTEDVLTIPLYRDLAYQITTYLQNHFDQFAGEKL